MVEAIDAEHGGGTMWTRWLALGLLVACGGKSDDSAGGAAGTGTPYLNVLSPTSGEYLDEGQDVLLEAEGGAEMVRRPSFVGHRTSTDGLCPSRATAWWSTICIPGNYALGAWNHRGAGSLRCRRRPGVQGG